MADGRNSTNVSRMIQERKMEAQKKLETLKGHIAHLERALNAPDIETQGVGIGWVHNVDEPLQSIKHHVAQIDALAGVQVFLTK